MGVFFLGELFNHTFSMEEPIKLLCIRLPCEVIPHETGQRVSQADERIAFIFCAAHFVHGNAEAAQAAGKSRYLRPAESIDNDRRLIWPLCSLENARAAA